MRWFQFDFKVLLVGFGIGLSVGVVAGIVLAIIGGVGIALAWRGS